MTTVIETDKLTKSYGAHRGIADVDLTVERGEVFGFQELVTRIRGSLEGPG